jgi:hypothetical protein
MVKAEMVLLILFLALLGTMLKEAWVELIKLLQPTVETLEVEDVPMVEKML